MADIIEFTGKKHRVVGLEEGEVLSENAEGLYEVLISDGPIWMKKCDGCLLKPEVGDEVIVVVTKKSVAILSILCPTGKPQIFTSGKKSADLLFNQFGLFQKKRLR